MDPDPSLPLAARQLPSLILFRSSHLTHCR